MGDARIPWEETWGKPEGARAYLEEFWGTGCLVRTEPDMYLVGGSHDDERGIEACATLAAAAPQLVRALLAVEWEVSRAYGIALPVCRACHVGNAQREHHPSCSVDAALRAAGLPDRASRDEARARMARSGR